MTDKTFWESFKVESENIVDKIKEVIHVERVDTNAKQPHETSKGAVN